MDENFTTECETNKTESEILFDKVGDFVSMVKETRKHNQTLLESFKDSCDSFVSNLNYFDAIMFFTL